MHATQMQIDLAVETEDFATDSMNAFEKDVATRILSVVRALPLGSAHVYLSQEDPHCHKLTIVPSNEGASRIEVRFYSVDPPNVSICAGVDVFLSLVTDVYRIEREQWGEFLEKMVRGIIDGTLEERLNYKGGLITKSEFSVRLDKELFTFSRGSLPNWLKAILKRKHKEMVRYAPYVD